MDTVTTPSASRIGLFRKITLVAKHYASIRDLVREMNGKQQMSIGKVDLFVGFFIPNGKIRMTFQYQSQVKVTVDCSPDLARLSGLRSDETYVTGEDVISEREPNLLSNIRSVYVNRASLRETCIAYLIRLCTFRCKRSVSIPWKSTR